MTIKEAIIKSLEDIQNGCGSYEVYQHIVKSNYYIFEKGKTPAATVSALLGDFIRNGDSRVKRIKGNDGTFIYYLSKNEKLIETLSLISPHKQESDKTKKTYDERSLHKLLSTYLKSGDTSAKTIFHEQSNKTDEYQKWVHPDMVGVKFIELKNSACQSLFKATNRIDTVVISSYELKKEINSDYELKRYFFQAVSNSSWANYGYLVAFEIEENLLEEMERLNQSFGIGIIKLKVNPFESKLLFPARYKALDFKTIEKLCRINKDFERFIEQVEKLMTATDKYIKATKKELNDFCDEYLETDKEVADYCKKCNIPQNN